MKAVFTLCYAWLVFVPVGYSQHPMPKVSFNYEHDVPRLRATFFDDVPVTNFPLSGLDADSQRLINQGIEVLHGFWIYAAEQAFRTVSAKYANHPMPLALAAYAQMIFGSGDKVRGADYFAKARALRRQGSVSLTYREELWFNAVAELYAENTSPEKRDSAHIAALEKIVQEFPEDYEAKAFLALHYWTGVLATEKVTGEEARELRQKTDAMIDAILAHEPKHPAHHYKIHLWNDGTEDFHALASARASGPAQAKTAHLWHMPAHIFSNTGDFAFAWWQVEMAHRVDHGQMQKNQLMPANIHNYYHNYVDFALPLKSALGQWRDAFERGKAMLRQGRLPFFASKFAHLRLARTLLREAEMYEAWEDILALENYGYFAHLTTGDGVTDLDFAMAKTRIVFLAHLHLGNFTKADSVFVELEKLRASIGEVNTPESKQILEKTYEDALLWREAFLRAPYGISARLVQRLYDGEVTPRNKTLLLAAEYGHEALAKKFFAEYEGEIDKLRSGVVLMDLWAYVKGFYVGKKTSTLLEQITRKLERHFVSPLWFEDFSELTMARLYKNELKNILTKSEENFSARFSHLPEEFSYMQDWSWEEGGPVDPVIFKLAPYVGDDIGVENALSSPELGKFNLVVFTQGPSCESCNEQLQKFAQAEAALAKVNIQWHAVSKEKPSGLAAFKSMGIWDEIENQPLHGVILMDSERRILWRTISEHAILDVDFLVAELARVTILDRTHH